MRFNLFKPLMMLAVAGVMLSPAQAALSIRITDPSGTQTFVTAGNALAAVRVGYFDTNIQVGTSNSPGGPAQITLGGTVTNSNAAGGTLRVEISSTGFLLPAGSATLIQTVNTNTPEGVSAPGSLTATGYYDGGNVLFCEDAPGFVCDAATDTANFDSFLVTNPGQISSVPVNFLIPFALDQVLEYTFTGTGTALVTSTLSAVVPEPASVALLGGVLLFTAAAIRRKTQKA